MPKSGIWLLSIALCGLFACKSPAEPAAEEAPTAEKAPADAPAAEKTPTVEKTPAPAADEAAAAEKPAAAPPAIRVTRVSGTDTAPATAYDGPPTTATATAAADGVQLVLADIVSFCAPPPAFAARIEGGAVIVQIQKPAEAPTRCIGPHQATLKIEGLPAGEHAISVRDQEGKEVTTAKVNVPG